MLFHPPGLWGQGAVLPTRAGCDPSALLRLSLLTGPSGLSAPGGVRSTCELPTCADRTGTHRTQARARSPTPTTLRPTTHGTHKTSRPRRGSTETEAWVWLTEAFGHRHSRVSPGAGAKARG